MGIEEKVAVNKFDVKVTNYTDEHHYTILWLKDGFKTISIDFNHFLFQPGSIYFVTPGRNIEFSYNKQPKGWILSFTKEIFNRQIKENLIIRDVDLFSSLGQTPKIILSPKIGDRIHSITEMIDELIGSEIPNRDLAIISLLKTLLIYCDSKCNIRLTSDSNNNQIHIVTTFKDLVAKNYMQIHKVSDYACMMNISTKYLNQVVKKVLGVTAKSVIQEQLIIQARRELKFSNNSIKEIAYKLGFSEPFHFSNYFKKMIGCSPSRYRHL